MKKSTIEAQDFYVYALFNPFNGLPFYIGKGRGRRWTEHEMLGDKHYNPMIRALLQAAKGRDIPKVKIREGLLEVEAFEIERAFIAALGRRKAGGILFNLTDGGDGSAGIVGPHKGKNFSAIHRERIRQSLLGRKHSEEARAKMRVIRASRKPISDETRKKMSDAAKARHPISDETRQKLRASAIATSLGKIGNIARWSRRRVDGVNVDQIKRHSVGELLRD